MENKIPERIEIKPNLRAGFFGLAAYPRAVTILCCQLGIKGGFNTGLTPEEEAYFEKELELKPKTLSKHSPWWGDVFNVEHTIRLFRTKTTELLLNTPINQIKYKVLLAHSDVANSEIEKNKPGVMFYINDEEAKAKSELKTLNFELEGMKLILNLTTDEKKGALRLFNKTGVETLSDDVCSAHLMQEMKKDPKNFFDTITDKELKTKMFIYELLENKILTRKGAVIRYGDDTIANSINEAVDYFNDIKNQTEKLTLETKLRKSKAKQVKQD